MSFIDKGRDLLRKYEDDVDLSGEDPVVATVARRNFDEAIPPDRPVGSLDPFINYISIPNLLISLIGNVLFVTSSAMMLAVILILFTLFITFGGPLSYQITHGFFSGFSLLALFAYSGLGLIGGLGLRKLDRIVTMRKCLGDAKAELRDKQLYIQEHCLLEMKKVEDEIEPELAAFRSKIKQLEDSLEVIIGFSEDLEEIPDLDQIKVEADLAPYNEDAQKLRVKIGELFRAMAKVKAEADKRKAELYQVWAMAGLVKIGETLTSLNDGSLDRQIEELQDSVGDRLLQIEGRVEDIQDELLAEAGLPAVDANNKLPK